MKQHTGYVKPEKNTNFLKNDKIVISVEKKSVIFLELGLRNGLHRWNRLAKSSYLVEFRDSRDFMFFEAPRATSDT